MQITKEELERRYNTTLLKDLALELGITRATLINYVKRNGIKLKGKGNRLSKSKVTII